MTMQYCKKKATRGMQNVKTLVMHGLRAVAYFAHLKTTIISCVWKITPPHFKKHIYLLIQSLPLNWEQSMRRLWFLSPKKLFLQYFLHFTILFEAVQHGHSKCL